MRSLTERQTFRNSPERPSATDDPVAVTRQADGIVADLRLRAWRRVALAAPAQEAILLHRQPVWSSPREIYRMNLERCPWPKSELDVAYHDTEWGVPVHDDRVLFEFLTLEGAQAGLSWSTILKKRPSYRRAFAEFDPARVARFTPASVELLLEDPGIVRNRLKVQSTVTNARAFLEVQAEHGTFDGYVWQFVGGQPLQNGRKPMDQIPARTAESDALSKDLRRRGFRFVGSTICYAFMQAVGMVNDHLVTCFRHEELAGEGGR